MKAAKTDLLRKIIMPVLAVVLSLALGAVIIVAAGRDPLTAYGYLLQGAFGSLQSWSETLVKATPLIFTGLAAVFAYRCGMLNLGAEGQFIMGAIAACWFGTAFPGVPAPLRLALCLVLAILAGGIWAAIPGYLKAKHHTNEMIITILLNYIATLFMSYLYSGPLMEDRIPQTAAVDAQIKLTRFLGSTRAHTGILLALLFVGLVYYFLFHTYQGYSLRVLGVNRDAARVNGFAVERYMILSFVISGMIAGLGGAVELLGASYRLQTGFGLGYGFDGVAIALIGQLHPLGTLLVAYLFAVLRCGANTMQVATGITTAIVDILQGIIIIFAVAGSALVALPVFQTLQARFAKRKEAKR